MPIITRTFAFLFQLLQHPLTLFVAMAGGVIAGAYSPEFGKALAPYATMFIDLMKSCVLPIVIASISLSVARLLTSAAHLNLSRILLVLAGSALISCILGTCLATFTHVGASIDPDSTPFFKSLAVQVSIVERSLTEALDPKDLNFLSFITQAIPNNIFTSLTNEKIFQVLTFSIIFGSSLAYISAQPRQTVLLLCEAMLQTFGKIFSAIGAALPFVVFALSAQTMKIGTDALLQMISYILYFYVGVAILFYLSLFTLKTVTRTSYREALSKLRYAYFIAFATSNSIAAIPATVDTLTKDFKTDKTKTSILIPLNIIIGRYGTIFYFAFTIIFMVQLYHLTLTPAQYGFVLFGSIIAGVSATGSPPPVALSMLTLIADPLGLPLDLLLTIIISIFPLIDPFIALLNVCTNVATTALMSEDGSRAKAKLKVAKQTL